MLQYVIDLDGTLASYKRGDARGNGIFNIGEPISGAQEFVRELSEHRGKDGEKAKITIFTRRLNDDDCSPDENKRIYSIIESWLNKHNFVWHEIYFKRGKPDGTAFIDDRGVQCRPQENADAYKDAISYIKDVIL